MEGINDISWFQFFSYAIVLVAIFIGYRLFVKNMIQKRLSLDKTKRLDIRFVLFNRIFLIIYCLLFLVLFIRVNPLLHSILCGLVLAVSYPYILNFVLGTFLIQEYKLSPGIQIGLSEAKQARITKVGRTNITTVAHNKVERIPYIKLLKNVSYSITGEESYVLRLLCSPMEENIDFAKNLDLVKKLLMMSPFLTGDIAMNWQMTGKEKAEFELSIRSKEDCSSIIEVFERNKILTTEK